MTNNTSNIMYVDYPTPELKTNNNKRIGLSLEQLALSDYQYFINTYKNIKNLNEEIKERCDYIEHVGNFFLPKKECCIDGCSKISTIISIRTNDEYVDIYNKKTGMTKSIQYSFRESGKDFVYCSQKCAPSEPHKFELYNLSLEATLYDQTKYQEFITEAINTQNWKVYNFVKTDTNKLVRLIAEEFMGIELNKCVKHTNAEYLTKRFNELGEEISSMTNRYFTSFPKSKGNKENFNLNEYLNKTNKRIIQINDDKKQDNKLDNLEFINKTINNKKFNLNKNKDIKDINKYNKKDNDKTDESTDNKLNIINVLSNENDKKNSDKDKETPNNKLNIINVFSDKDKGNKINNSNNKETPKKQKSTSKYIQHPLF